MQLERYLKQTLEESGKNLWVPTEITNNLKAFEYSWIFFFSFIAIIKYWYKLKYETTWKYAAKSDNHHKLCGRNYARLLAEISEADNGQML